jgi:FemAB-related protein (PEP-CTERM system-associated)
MQVVEYTNDWQVRWDACVLQQEKATLFHGTAWKRIIERAFGYKSCYLLAEEAGRVIGVLPLFLVSNPVTGRTLISSPFAVYGGVCSQDDEARHELISAACALADKNKVEYLELRLREGDGITRFVTKDLYVTFDMEIDSDHDRLFKGLPRDTRYMIRKSQKAGLATSFGTERLNDFYEVYAQSVRNLGTPVFSKKFFRIILEELGENAEIMVVRKDQTPVAAVMSFRFRDWILPYYGGSTLEGRQYAANNFMYWELLESARQRGIRRFDFGRSKRGTGAYDFKSGWNMRESALPYQFHLVKRQELPNFSPTNPKFSRVIDLWKRIPFPVTKAIGPALVKLFP